MKFNDIIKSILVEDKDSVDAVSVITSSCFEEPGPRGRELRENDLKQVIEGKIGEVMIKLMEDALKQSDNFVNKYERPQSLEEIEVVEVTLDSLPSPTEIHCYLWWKIKSQWQTINVTFSISCLVVGKTMSKEDELPISISLKQLREIQQNELSDDAMKGHELEDLYNL